MVKIIYQSHDGVRREVDGDIGASVMETAIANGVPGIDANCGGACSCATCHVFVDPDWVSTVGGPNPMEEGMLEFVDDVQPNSRLSCQIRITQELDGLTVTTPAEQQLV
jgi:2Fe-2S ferredoxin